MLLLVQHRDTPPWEKKIHSAGGIVIDKLLSILIALSYSKWLIAKTPSWFALLPATFLTAPSLCLCMLVRMSDGGCADCHPNNTALFRDISV